MNKAISPRQRRTASFLLARATAIIFSTVASSVWAASTEWPEFRGPAGQGISEAKNVPLEWSTTKNVAWRTAIPGGGWSSPALAGGRIYVTTAVPGGDGSLSLRTLCLSASDGKIIWDVEVFHPEGGQIPNIHSKNSQASPTPIVRDGRVYVHFGHLGTAALKLDGTVLWRQSTLKYPPMHGNGGSPALVDDLLIFSCDGLSNPFVVALDKNTGEIRWRHPRQTQAKKTFSFCTPLLIHVNDRPELILPGSGFVGSYNPRTGDEYWRVGYGEGYSVVPRPVYAQGLIFVSSGFDHPVLYAVNPAGASGDSAPTHVAWTSGKAAPNTPSTLVVDDLLYFVSDGGVGTCASPKTGEVYWSERLGGNYSASPVFAEGRVYFQNEEGTGTVIQHGREFKVLAKNDIGERTLASYAVADGTIYIRSAQHIWKISADTPAR